MRKILYLISIVVIVGNILLIMFSPDPLSIAVIFIMLAIIGAGLILGIFPILSMSSGLSRGVKKIDRALAVQTESMWATVTKMEGIFEQKVLDTAFEKYKERIAIQNKTGQMLGDVDDYINSELISLHSWNGVVMQIPGTLTGLGILGTFVGLIIGISEIGFSSVDATLSSVQTLLNGIHIAFYTSIAGIILSIVFNILHKTSWNVSIRELDIFIDSFHKNVIPTVEEQDRYRQQLYRKNVLERLDRIPKNPGFSISNVSGGMSANGQGQKNEQILMPQIIDGLKNNKFVFVLQPKYDLNTRKIVSAEAFVRWNHDKLGVVSPAVFLPIVEQNGYITKLDEYVWDNVCSTVRSWIDKGIRSVPISLNISKMDILAGDIEQLIEKLVAKYRIPPRSLEIEIARNAFLDASETTVDIASKLRQKGFKIIMDGFDGDFIPIQAIQNIEVDELKFDIRNIDFKEQGSFIKSVIKQAKQFHYSVSVEGIESMEQVTTLRKLGCVIGQGFYFSKPISQEEFIQSLEEEK